MIAPPFFLRRRRPAAASSWLVASNLVCFGELHEANPFMPPTRSRPRQKETQQVLEVRCRRSALHFCALFLYFLRDSRSPVYSAALESCYMHTCAHRTQKPRQRDKYRRAINAHVSIEFTQAKGWISAPQLTSDRRMSAAPRPLGRSRQPPSLPSDRVPTRSARGRRSQHLKGLST